MLFRPELSALGRRYAAATFLLCLAAVVYLSLAPGGPAPASELPLDKAAHALAYFVLTGVGMVAFGPRGWLLLLVFLVGAGLEAAQARMELGRQGELGDLAANLVGQGLAILVWRLWTARR